MFFFWEENFWLSTLKRVQIYFRGAHTNQEPTLVAITINQLITNCINLAHKNLEHQLVSITIHPVFSLLIFSAFYSHKPGKLLYPIKQKQKDCMHLLKKEAARYWEFSPFLARTSIYWWYTYPPEKYECAKWDDDIPNWMEIHKIPWFQSPPTSLGFKPTHWEYLGLWAMGITWYPFQSLEVMIQPFWTLFWTPFLIAKFCISPSNLMKSQRKKKNKNPMKSQVILAPEWIFRLGCSWPYVPNKH